MGKLLTISQRDSIVEGLRVAPAYLSFTDTEKERHLDGCCVCCGSSVPPDPCDYDACPDAGTCTVSTIEYQILCDGCEDHVPAEVKSRLYAREVYEVCDDPLPF